MNFQQLDIAALLTVTPCKRGDDRGYFAEVFREDLFDSAAEQVRFVQENQSLSAKKGTVRGIHFQSHPCAQGKLVRCTAGAIFDVAVDLRVGSPTYGRWAAVELTPEACNQLWIPVGFGHAFCTLEPNSVVSYKVTSYYSAEFDKGLRWDDPTIAIQWPDCIDPETLSVKDRAQPLLNDLPTYFRYKD